MISIEFKDGQGLGNQLWLYASAKSISEKIGLDLEIKNFNKFKALDFLKLDINISPNSVSRDSKEDSKFYEKLYYDSELKYIISDFDENVLNIKKNTLLEGIFQSEQYFFGDFEKLKRYIKVDENLINNYPIKKNVCILNIRGGEYKRHHDFILPKIYWLNAIENFKKKYKINHFKIVTDDYLYAKALFPKFEIISDDIAKCFITIYNCSNIVVSNSSFSYFPCRIGKTKKNIIAPMYWARPYKNKGRWISPGNIYKDWQYQDISSKLISYDECKKIAIKTSEYYKNNFYIFINKREIPSKGFLNILPKKFKIILKNKLKYIFPKIIG
tara:strand:+ start:1039 stop:2022 length:984 start_codon:yes stop_codon:yes gene_type:complete